MKKLHRQNRWSFADRQFNAARYGANCNRKKSWPQSSTSKYVADRDAWQVRRLCQALCVATIKFGTDGWRAVIAENFNFANVARVAQATADYWKAESGVRSAEVFGHELKVVVGFDRRFFSDASPEPLPRFLPATVFKSSSRRNRRRRRRFPSRSSICARLGV